MGAPATRGLAVDATWSTGANYRIKAGAKVAEHSYDFTKKVAGGIEYYGATGPATEFSSISEQEHQIFPTIDLNLSPKWEFNFGVGVGLTHDSDGLIITQLPAAIAQ